jgi:broad specificity phosphatase PhoE
LGTAYRIGWFLGYSPNADSFKKANARAKLGAERLVALAKESRSVSLVGHGIINSLIAKHLVALGWLGPKRPAHGYWQANIYDLAA